MELMHADIIHNVAETESKNKDTIRKEKLRPFIRYIMDVIYERAKEGGFNYMVKICGKDMEDTRFNYETIRKTFVEKGYKVCAITESERAITFKIKW